MTTSKAQIRLPLQVGHGALGQGARYAATIWIGILLLIISAGLPKVSFLLTIVDVLAAMFFLAFAVEGADIARRERPCDVTLDAFGLAIEGGPLDGKGFRWQEVNAARCVIVDGKARRAWRWQLLGWLTGGKVGWIQGRLHVPVLLLHLPQRGGGEPIVLAEVEGDERESLEHLRDSIIAAATTPSAEPADAPSAAPGILACPTCAAAQVPIDAERMTCPSCSHELEVPAELRERLRAAAALVAGRAPQADMVRRLVEQPGATAAARVIAWCRRAMFWSQPLAIAALVTFLFHQTKRPEYTYGIELSRLAPSDDGVFFHDLALFGVVIVGVFAVSFTFGAAYLGSRSALRLLADHFGAVPPVRPGAPSTCRRCGGPLPEGAELLRHCVYCGADNILGVDPRPAAARHQREELDLAQTVRKRRRARIRLAITAPLCALALAAMGREVVLAWRVQGYGEGSYSMSSSFGTITNDDWLRREVTFRAADGTITRATILAHGALSWGCSDCTVATDHGAALRVKSGASTLRVVRGELREAP
jgi:hypothetical protein